MGHKLCHENDAPFPEALAEWFIRSFCPPGGTVLDPFVGSGTTAAVALMHGRNAIGIDVRQDRMNLTGCAGTDRWLILDACRRVRQVGVPRVPGRRPPDPRRLPSSASGWSPKRSSKSRRKAGMGSQPEQLDGKRRGSRRGSSVVAYVGRKPEALDGKRRGFSPLCANDPEFQIPLASSWKRKQSSHY